MANALAMVARGCDLNNPESVQKFLAEAERKKTNVRRYQEARGSAAVTHEVQRTHRRRDSGAFEHQGNGQALGPPGKRGAAHALARLELQEEEGYRRLQAALASG